MWRHQSLCRVIYVIYKSGHFRFVDGLFGGGVPDDRSIFKCWSNKGLITVWFVWSWAFAGVTSKKDKGAIGFLYDSIYLVVLGQFAIDIYA